MSGTPGSAPDTHTYHILLKKGVYKWIPPNGTKLTYDHKFDWRNRCNRCSNITGYAGQALPRKASSACVTGYRFFYCGGTDMQKRNMQEKRSGWKWNCGGRILLADRNVARDRNMFRPPKIPDDKISPQSGLTHTGERTNVIAWQWPGDNRIFLVPVELFAQTRLSGLVRDLVAATGQLYREQGFPADRQVSTSYRQICAMLGLAYNGRVAQEIGMGFAYARCFTIVNHPVIIEITKSGRIKKEVKTTFGFLDQVTQASIIDGRKVPVDRAPVTVVLSEMYAAALQLLPSVPVPVAALEAARRAPWRLVGPAKNLVYYLSARVPAQRVRLLLPTLLDILGLTGSGDGHASRQRETVENVLEVLHPTMVLDYRYADGGYDITLAGRPGKT